MRNLGKPVALCKRYYDEGADEVAFLNITSFREGVLEDTPMLALLTAASENVFVPLTVGGGIREYTEPSGKTWSALDVAAQYFRYDVKCPDLASSNNSFFSEPGRIRCRSGRTQSTPQRSTYPPERRAARAPSSSFPGEDAGM